MEITLTVGQALWAFILALGIPSAITGFLVWNFERKIAKREAKREKEQEERHKKEAEREKAREELQIHTIQGVSAAIALGEATAKAVQRIPDAHCNGDMHDALNYAIKIKHEQKDFLTRMGIASVVE
ncbi:serine/threonine protein kinase [Dysosmobacter welbionis]|jgi:hypothetical protein